MKMNDLGTAILNTYNTYNHYGNENGMRYTILHPGEIEYEFEIQEQHLSNPFAAHGGAIAGFMDAVLGVSALSLAANDGNLVSTVQFQINYFAPIQLGDQLIGKGSIDFKGKSIIVSSAQIFKKAENKLVAKGTGTFNAYPVNKSPIYQMLFPEQK